MQNGNITQDERQKMADILSEISKRTLAQDPKINQLCREGRKLLASNPREDIWLLMDEGSARIVAWLMKFVLGGVGPVEEMVANAVAKQIQQQLPKEE